jgi:dUTP pyrophosphatase
MSIETTLKKIREEQILPSPLVDSVITMLRQQQEIILQQQETLGKLKRESKVKEYLLKVKLLNEEARLPEYAYEGDTGLDLFSTSEAVIQPGKSALIPTGISIQLPPKTEAQIRPRSGLALKHQVTVLNGPGTVDEGYRGEIGVILINHGTLPFKIEVGMKIAQMVIQPVLSVKVEKVEKLNETDRGVGGFGSTGI